MLQNQPSFKACRLCETPIVQCSAVAKRAAVPVFLCFLACFVCFYCAKQVCGGVQGLSVSPLILLRATKAQCCYTPMLKSLKFLQGDEEERARRCIWPSGQGATGDAVISLGILHVFKRRVRQAGDVRVLDNSGLRRQTASWP